MTGIADGVILVDGAGAIAWANDAALAMHGVASLAELGTDVDGYRQRFELRFRNNHRLAETDYPIARAAAGEAFGAVIVEVRTTGADDPLRVHSVRSPGMRAAAGQGVLIITDVTESCRAEERFERAFNANPPPAVICRLADLRYLKVNAGFLEMTGLAREQVVARSAYELDVLAGAERRDLALERLKDGRAILPMEARIRTAGGATRTVMVAGEPVRLGGEPCMLFTFADLEPLRRAETALRDSEERFARSFQLSPVAQLTARLDGFVIAEVNEAFERLLGRAPEQVVGRGAAELGLWVDRTVGRQVAATLRQSGVARGLSVQLRTAQDVAVDCLASAVGIVVAGEPGVLCLFEDISSRRRSEHELMAAIEAVMAEGSWFSRTIVEKLAALRRATASSAAAGELDELTDRERDILGLICQGQSDLEMSRALKLSRNTVRNHVASLYRKIGVNRRGAAIIWARERGITGRDGLAQASRKRARNGRAGNGASPSMM